MPGRGAFSSCVVRLSAAPHAGRQARLKAGEQRTLLLANGKFQFETSRPSLLLTHIVLFTFHIMRTERDCRSTRKAGEHRRAFPGVGAGLGGGGAPNWLADTRSFRAACAPLRRAGSGIGIKRGPETEVGAYGEASRRLGEAAQALCQVGPLHGQFYRRAVSRGIISQDA